MRRINIYITKQQTDKLNELSKEDSVSISEHIRRAINAYIISLLSNRNDQK